MRLQRQTSRKIGSKKYRKFVVIIPPHTVKDIGWKKGEKIEPKIENGKLVLKRKN